MKLKQTLNYNEYILHFILSCSLSFCNYEFLYLNVMYIYISNICYNFYLNWTFLLSFIITFTLSNM